jgi:hypothetical protein
VNAPETSVTRQYSFVYHRPRNMGWPTIYSRRYNGDIQEIIAKKIRVSLQRKDGEKLPAITQVALRGQWGNGRVIDAWMSLNYRKDDHYYSTDAPDWVMELVADAIRRMMEDDDG